MTNSRAPGSWQGGGGVGGKWGMADGGGGVQAGAVERKIGLRLGWLGYGGAHDVSGCSAERARSS